MARLQKQITDFNIGPVKQQNTTLNILVYGDSGVGKTVFAGSSDAVPSMRKVLVIDIEGGTSSLIHTYPNVDSLRVKTWKEMQEVYDAFYYSDMTQYNTVILDSLTEIQKFSMYNIMDDLVKEKPDRDADVPSMREWGKNLEQIRKFVRGFRDLPVNAIFTALAKETKNDLTGEVTWKPSLTGKLVDEIAGFLDVVLYYYVKDITNQETKEVEHKRVILTQKTNKYVAKDRSGKLPMLIEDPTMKKVHELLAFNN